MIKMAGAAMGLGLLWPASAAITFVNGDFEAGGGSLSGWIAGGTTSLLTAGPIAGAASAQMPGTAAANSLTQDFTPTPADALTNFTLEMQFRLSGTPTADANWARIRLRGESAQDFITLAFDNDGVRSFVGTFGDDLSGFAITGGTNYWLRVTGTATDTAGRTFQIGLSSDGVNWTTTTSTRFHGTTAPAFGSLVIDGSGGGITVDSITIVPEPGSAALAGLAGLGLLVRRRRR